MNFDWSVLKSSARSDCTSKRMRPARISSRNLVTSQTTMSVRPTNNRIAPTRAETAQITLQRDGEQWLCRWWFSSKSQAMSPTLWVISPIIIEDCRRKDPHQLHQLARHPMPLLIRHYRDNKKPCRQQKVSSSIQAKAISETQIDKTLVK